MNLELQAQSLLIATRKLLTPEERWGQGHYYADLDEQDEPHRFCLVGAMLHEAKVSALDVRTTEGPANVALGRLEDRIKAFLHHWNDAPDRTHAEVLKLLDDTIGQEGK